jgi:hypothetical protein
VPEVMLERITHFVEEENGSVVANLDGGGSSC